MDEPVALGIDLGTSELKAVLLDRAGTVLAQHSAPLFTDRPEAGWSEQEPERWWQACVGALADLRRRNRAAYARVRCIGLSGQMHGAVLVDRQDRCIRPAILWNDSRALAEANLIARTRPSFADITGSLPMAGFTAPKLLWLQKNEPAAFKAIDCVLSPKDYLRLKLTGDRITDVSDAAGTLWLDVRKRQWFEPMIAATGLDLRQMPKLVESPTAAGVLSPFAAGVLGLDSPVTVAAGAGDNPASGVGIAAVNAGQSFITLGTSAAVVSITDQPLGNAAAGVHNFCHAIPARWYSMGAILSGASCVKWITGLLSLPSEQQLIERISARMPINDPVSPHAPLFLPYLSGERTPHNDPLARGGLMNLTHDSSVEMLGYAVLEGVGFALRDAMNAVEASGAMVGSCSLVGGGARSEYWGQLLANILGRELHLLANSSLTASMGAARLGLCALEGSLEVLQHAPTVRQTFVPNRTLHSSLQERYERFRQLYPAVRALHEPN